MYKRFNYRALVAGYVRTKPGMKHIMPAEGCLSLRGLLLSAPPGNSTRPGGSCVADRKSRPGNA